MRKIKYLIFGLLLGCLGLTSFSSAVDYTCNEAFSLTEDSLFTINSLSFGDDQTSFEILDYDENIYFHFDMAFRNDNYYGTIIKNLSFVLGPSEDYWIGCQDSNASFSVVPVSSISDCPSVPSGGSCSNTGTVSDLTNSILLFTGSVSLNNSSYTNIFNYGNNGAGTYCVKLSSSSPQTLTFGFANGGTTAPTNLYQLYNDQYSQVVCLYGNKPYFNAKLNSSSNTVSYEVYKLSDLYSSDVCLESSSSCPSCEDCSSIQESLSGCLEDYDSVSNMNQSLSDELEACLESGGGGCNPETDTGCVEGAILPLLSWSVGLDSFSTPIINNLTLPTNYKGKLVDGVLSISSINQNLSIDDSDYGNIKDSFVNIVLYIFGVGLMLILVYYIKFYFFNIKD